MAFKIIDPGVQQAEQRIPEEGGILSDILKNVAVGGTGLAAGALGAIPSATSLLASGGQWLSEQLSPEDVGTREFLEKIKGAAELATPEKLQEYASKLTGGYLEPKGRFQKGVSEVTQDIGSIVGLGGSLGAGARIATLGNAAKQSVKQLGGSEGIAETAKLVGMMTSPLFRFNKIESLYKTLYSGVRKSIDPKSVTPSRGIYDAAKEVMEVASKGGSVPYKNSTRRFANSVALKIKNKRIPIEELWEFKKDLNEITTRGVFASRKRAILKPLEKAIRKSLNAYGKRNKKFGYALKNADTLFGIQKGLPLLDKAINKAVGLRDSGVSEYFRKSMAWGFGGLKGLFAKQYIGSLSKRGEAFLRSPAYRKASMQLAKATTKNSLPLTVNAVRKLEKIRKENMPGKYTIIKA